MRWIIALLIPLAFVGCYHEESAVEAAFAYGLDEVEILGSNFWGCPGWDLYTTKFKAVDEEGDEVEGTVCCRFGALAPHSCYIRS